MPQQSVAIIGAGIGGLATAALLAKAGYKVTVIEKNDRIGGKAAVWTSQGFTFDMGPSWYLMPDAFDRYFSHFEKKSSDVLDLIKLDPQYRGFFESGGYVDISADFANTLSIFESIEPGSAIRVQQYMKGAKERYELAMNHFLYRQYTSIGDLLKPSLILQIHKLLLSESLDSVVSRYVSSEKLKKIMEYTAVFLGCSPKKTPALYSMMSYIDFCLGVSYPMGGMYKIIEAIKQLCDEYGVTVLTSTEVRHIQVIDGIAKEVITDSGIFSADIVISNADLAYTETRLLDAQWSSYPEDFWRKKTIAPSSFILYLGVKGRVNNIKHHNLMLSDSWDEHFKDIFDNPQWTEHPSYYVCCASKTDPSIAPHGDENLFVLVPVAAGLDDTDEVREAYAKAIISSIETYTGEHIADRLLVRRIYSQRDFHSDYHAYNGTAFGLSHTLFQTALFRPHNKSKKVKNIYYTGQYVQPGIGLPICLISAELTASLITLHAPR